MRAFKAIKLLRSASFKIAEITLEQTLKLDPVSQQQLKKLNGKRVAIHTRMPEFKLVMAFDDGTIKLLNDSDRIDAEISCSFSNLILLLTGNDPSSLLYSGEIDLSGDSKLIDEMHQILAHLDLDWEALLATLVGDTVAHNVGNLSRTGWRWQKQRSASLILDIDEYLKEEAQWLPAKPATDHFYSEVDQIRLDADRLRARVQRLSTLIQKKQTDPSQPANTAPDKPSPFEQKDP